ncbi:MAG: response regulator [Nanoarchaeota archaeon]
MKKILIVEDEKTQAKAAKIFIEDNLEEIGTDCIVFIVYNVAQALGRLSKDMPDLILLDIVMPGDYGTELLKKLKRNKLWQDIPVIVLTIVSPIAGIKEDVRNIDPNAGFLEKPYTKAQLLTEIKAKLSL